MSSASSRREQYQRWHVRECIRCGRTASKAANWEGPICRTCYDRATKTYGHCQQCGAQRLLPGRDAGGAPICRDCAAITRDFFCSGCGAEAALLRGRRCHRCTLTDKLNELLDDGTGHIRHELIPLWEGLRTTDRMKSTMDWLAQPQVAVLLTSLAQGDVAITHEALAAQPNWRTASFLRELLMHHGVLLKVDKQLMLFERWLPTRLASINDPDHAQVVTRFATWHELRRLRANTARDGTALTTTNPSRQRINRAIDFLSWLAERGKTLHTASQSDIDDWHTVNYGTRSTAQTFMRWAITAGHMPDLIIPWRTNSNPAPMAQHQRLAAIKKLIEHPEMEMPLRIAGLLALFYAQPTTRIVRLTTGDIIEDSQNILIRLGDPPAQIPEPLAEMMREFLTQRRNSRSPNADTDWLFPGRRAGQPITAGRLGDQLREQGIAVQSGRTSALRQLVLQAPAPVIASMLGFHPNHTARLVAEGGGTWNRYAPGDHER